MCFAGSGNGEQGPGNGVAERVARVAVEMTAVEFYWPTANRVQLRIGIHSGPITAGVIGTTRMQYDIWGDTVNVASRMESTGLPGRVNASRAIYDALSSNSQFVFESRGAIDVKGKGLTEMYFLSNS